MIICYAELEPETGQIRVVPSLELNMEVDNGPLQTGVFQFDWCLHDSHRRASWRG